MSVQTELQRIIQAKADIVTSIENKGVTVPSGTTIDNLDDYVDQIQQGGPTPEPTPWAANECFHIDLIETDADNGFVLLYFTQNGSIKEWDELPFTAYWQRTSVNGTPSDSNWVLCSRNAGGVPTMTNTGDNFRRVWLKIENPDGFCRVNAAVIITKWQMGFYNLNQTKLTGTGTKIELGGNLMSLLSIYKDVDLPKYAFSNFFNGNKVQIDASALIFPNTTSQGCYASMFISCSNLAAAPVLPATTLAPYCYYKMFFSCTNLLTTPALPATTLYERCYNSMFQDCKQLTTIQTIAATTLAKFACEGMFHGCTALTTAPELPALILEEGCYNSMFSGCTALTTAPELPATSLASRCYASMFIGCTALTTAPELPALILEEGCYNSMFSGCTNLNYIKCLATDISASSCTTGWVNSVAATGTFVKDASMSGWTTGTAGIPSGWTVETAAA